MKQPTHTPRARSRWVALALALGLALAGCASPSGAAAPAPGTAADTPAAAQTAGSSTFPVDVVTGAADSGQTITLATQPKAIISLSPTATETLFAIGAGDQVIAVDDQSDYPENAPRTDLSGYRPNVEAILGHSPDLVVTTNASEDLVASLRNASVPTLVLPSAKDLPQAYEQIERLGTATGHRADAKALVARMSTEIDAIVASVPAATGVTYFHELDPTLYTVTGQTFIGEVYGLFGLASIADSTSGSDPYPQLSEEFVVDANPDLVFLADSQCCGVTPEQVGQRAGWAQVKAVEKGQVHVLDEDVASRWGPRVVDFVKAVAEHVKSLEAAKA